jgi:hypothetical protein
VCRLEVKEVKQMATHVLPHTRERLAVSPAAKQWLWLGGGFVLAFLIPFVFADALELNRDVYYGLYAAAVFGYVAAWSRATQQSLRRLASRRLGLTIGLAAVASLILALMVYRSEDSATRPEGIEFAAAIVWRGILYGATDGLLLSVFPILAVFAAFAGASIRGRRGGTALVGLIALIASLAMTAAYHAGYSDFRGEKVRKPLAGDLVWSAPTLLTLNPVGAPIAHIALHTTAVVHSYETDTFLPPHGTE